MADESRPLSNDLIAAMEAMADALPAHDAQYALIGGIAAGLRSKLRYTEDIDLIVAVPQLRFPGLLESLIASGFSCDIIATIREWNQHQMIVLHYHSVRVDWIKPVLPAYQHVIDSATSESWNGRDIRLATTEGLILTKLIASRDQDLADINVLLAASRGRLKLQWIEQEWNSLFDADDPRWRRYLQSVAEYYETPTS